MRVSDEMMRAAWHAFRTSQDERGHSLPTSVLEALEAALSDVPEPRERAETVADGYADMVRQQQDRIAELEARLASVREWAKRDSEREDVLDILDGERAKEGT